MSNDFFNNTTALTKHTLARAEAVSSIFDAIAAGFDKLPAEAVLKQGRVTWGEDTGAANAYVVALPHTPNAYTAGLTVEFLPANTNTGAATINVNGLGVKSIKTYAGVDPGAGDLTVDAPVTLKYNGTHFRIQSAHTSFINDASDSATAAAASASAASTSETNAATSASSAATSATNAATSASEAAASAASINLPAIAGNGERYLRAKADEEGQEYRTPVQVRGDLGFTSPILDRGSPGNLGDVAPGEVHATVLTASGAATLDDDLFVGNIAQVQLWRSGTRNQTLYGATNGGNLELGSGASADGGTVGAVLWAADGQDSGHQTICAAEASLAGATAGQLGSVLAFWTKANGTAAPAQTLRLDRAAAVTPGSDNAITSGGVSYRWSELYSANTTINSSDGRLKRLRGSTALSGSVPSADDMVTAAISVAERRAFLAVQVVAYQMWEALERKGGAARIHIGPVTQQVAQAFEAEGLDVRRYSFWCEDPLTEVVEEPVEVKVQATETVEVEREVVEVVNGQAVLTVVTDTRRLPMVEVLPLVDASGNPVLDDQGQPRSWRRPVMTTVQQSRTVDRPLMEADGVTPVTRQGIRASQLLYGIMDALRAQVAEHAARLAAAGI